MSKLIRYLVIFIVPFVLLQCATSAKSLTKISLGMIKGEVISALGEPTAARGSITNKYDQVVEVWEYRLYQYEGAIEGLSPYYNLYWLYFVDNKLVQWGQAGDWEREADRIYEIRFR